MAPFLALLSSKNKDWYWDSTLEAAFLAPKEAIVEAIKTGVCAFEIGRATCLLTDWAKIGIGFVLMQKHCNCVGKKLTPECGDGHWKIVFAGSRFTTDTESRYAPIEGEALAVVHGLESSRMFVLGCPKLTVAVDHKPLLRFFDDRPLDTIQNPRLFKLKEKTLMYDFAIEYIAGKKNCGSDIYSRNPFSASPQDFDENEHACVSYATKMAEEVKSITWEQVREAASVDREIIDLVELIRQGFPGQRSQVPEHLRQFWQMRDELHAIDGVPFLNGKMLIPTVLRGSVLEALHAAHQGAKCMSLYAKDRFFWPGINTSIRQVREHCKQCNEQAPSQREEPTIMPTMPEVPFEQVVTDFFELSGHNFLIYADRYSGWIEIAKMPSKDFKQTHNCMMRWFTTFGVPKEIGSDGGPPFNSFSYSAFLDRWNVRLRMSSAHYPQSNGRAEAAVKSAKRILLGNIDPVTGSINTENATRSLLTYRNTPLHDTGTSPAEMLFGRAIRDHLPNQRRVLRKEWHEIASAREQAHARRHVIKRLTTPSGTLEPLEVGQVVQVQNQYGAKPGKWYNTGIIAEVLPHRQYRVMMDGSRRVTLRNRRFIRPIDPVARNTARYPSNDPIDIVCEQDTTVFTPGSDNKVPATNQKGLAYSEALQRRPPVSQGDVCPTVPGRPSTMTTVPLQSEVDVRSPVHVPPKSLDKPLVELTTLRRSTRLRKAPRELVLSGGKSYSYTEQ